MKCLFDVSLFLFIFIYSEVSANKGRLPKGKSSSFSTMSAKEISRRAREEFKLKEMALRGFFSTKKKKGGAEISSYQEIDLVLQISRVEKHMHAGLILGLLKSYAESWLKIFTVESQLRALQKMPLGLEETFRENQLQNIKKVLSKDSFVREKFKVEQIEQAIVFLEKTINQKWVKGEWKEIASSYQNIKELVSFFEKSFSSHKNLLSLFKQKKIALQEFLNKVEGHLKVYKQTRQQLLEHLGSEVLVEKAMALFTIKGFKNPNHTLDKESKDNLKKFLNFQEIVSLFRASER